MATYPGQRKKATIALAVGETATDGTVTATLMDPDGDLTAVSVTDEAGTGAYSAEFTVDKEGPWRLRVASTGDVVAAAEVAILVTASPFVAPN